MRPSFLTRTRLSARKLLFGGLIVSLIATGSNMPAQASETETPPAPIDSPTEIVNPLDELPDTEAISIGEPGANGVSAPGSSDGRIQAGTADDDEVEIGLPIAGEDGEITTERTAVYSEVSDQVTVSVQGVDVQRFDDVAAGVRSVISIHSADSPTEYEFPLSLPDGARAEIDNDSGTVVVLNDDDNVIGGFGSPWAVDAAGATIPTHFEIKDNSLVQHIEHQGSTYPVIADPIWFVPVIVAGARVAIPIVVRAASKKAAQSAAKKIAAKQTGKKVTKVKKAQKATYKSHTRANVRHNLIVRTGKNPKHCHAHHTMPVKFDRNFKNAGINIHEPKYTAWWNSTKGKANNHQSKARAYNNEWEKFFRDNRSKKEILDKRTKMHNKYKKFYAC